MEKRNLDLKYEKSTYIRAWKNYEDWYKTNGIMLSARTLFDFFDINRIFIEITPGFDFVEQLVNVHNWTFTIINNDHKVREYGLKYDSRKLAECAAFKLGFKVLENKLEKIEIDLGSPPKNKKKRRR